MTTAIELQSARTEVDSGLPTVLKNEILREQRNLAHLVMPTVLNSQKLSRNGKQLPGKYVLAYSGATDESLSAALREVANSVEAHGVTVEVFEYNVEVEDDGPSIRFDIYRKL